LSGIATLTSDFVTRVAGTKAKILDTRKTVPGYRILEKYAVRMGGGSNHRMGLYDMILIKDNHIAAAGGISNAVQRAIESLGAEELDLKIEVEVTNMAQLEEAIGLSIKRVLLDNMSLKEIQDSVKFINGRVETEVSGGVTIETVREFAETGVDFISVGALTHSAKAMDFSLLLD
jgi:nicotinate-nucleotide pyrophosphorylase (carboxylating)